MDILAHGLWTTAAGAAWRRKTSQPPHLGWFAAWGVAPDLVFVIPAAVRIWRLLTGASRSLLPDGRGPRFDWVFGPYNATHSAIVFTVCFGAVWLLLRRPMLEMLGWAIHIFLDVFTHGGMFAIQVLWPLSPVHLDGARWETPWLMAVNYAVLASVFLLIWITRRRAARPPSRS